MFNYQLNNCFFKFLYKIIIFKPALNFLMLLIDLFVFSNFKFVNANENELRFSYLTTVNGLSNNYINSIKQDKQGYIWIATAEGLNRYDGYENKIFKKILNDSSSLADNMVFSLFIDHMGNLWVGTQSGLCLYNNDKENFKTYILDYEGYRLNTANRVTSITEDSKKDSFLFQLKPGIYTITIEKKISS